METRSRSDPVDDPSTNGRKEWVLSASRKRRSFGNDGEETQGFLHVKL